MAKKQQKKASKHATPAGAVHEGRRGEVLTGRERAQLLAGFLVFLFSLFLFIAFGSHLFTWQADQSLEWANLLRPFDIEADNVMGPVGATLAARCMSKGLGVAALGFPLLLLFLSLYLFRVPQRGLARKVTLILCGMLLTSVTLAYFFGYAKGYMGYGLGGRMGYYVAQWLIHSISGAGTLFLLLFLMVSYAVWIDARVATKLFKDYPQQVKSFFHAMRAERKIRHTTKATNPTTPAVESTKTNEEPSPEAENEESTPPPVVAPPSEEKAHEEEPEKKEEEAEEVISPQEEKQETAPTAEETPQESDGDTTSSSPAAESAPPEKAVQEEKPAEHHEKAQEEKSTQAPTTPTSKPSLEVTTPTPALESVTRKTTKQLESDSENVILYNPLQDPPKYEFPKSELLIEHGAEIEEVSDEELNRNKDQIIDTLLNYKITIERIRATVGPTVTLYEIIPSPGIRVSKIKNLEDDIALSLAALGIRIIAPMPGMGTIGIEVPNETPSIVSMRSIVRSEPFRKSTLALPVGLGKTIANEVYMLDLAKAPHLLVAGATGQGKSVGLNAIITSLLYKKRPSELKFLLVDPKKVELTLYRTIADHYLVTLGNGEPGIVTENEQVIDALLSLCQEMDNRYLLLKEANVRHIKEYNRLVLKGKLKDAPQPRNENGTLLEHHYLPYIVVMIDEYADLIMTAGKDVELPLTRLAQLARAIGIHLVIATQRPLASIITGLIKANFPARIAFRVLSSNDSRTILETSGANQLIGRGDMLISLGGDLVRVQCAFVDTPEIEAICDHIAKEPQPSCPCILPTVNGDGDGKDGKRGDRPEVDTEFKDCARFVVSQQRCSASSLQTHFSIGYAKASRIVSHMEYFGIVGKQPANSQRTRDVLITDMEALENLLDTI